MGKHYQNMHESVMKSRTLVNYFATMTPNREVGIVIVNEQFVNEVYVLEAKKDNYDVTDVTAIP